MTTTGFRLIPVLALLTLGALAATAPWLEKIRLGTGDEIPKRLDVVSPLDNGPGSLREALFLALKADHHVDIAITVKEIKIDTPLPPISSTRGLRLSGTDTNTTIRYTGSDSRVLFRVQSNNVVFEHLSIIAENSDAIWVTAAGFGLKDVRISRSDIGLLATDPIQLVVRDSSFEGNKIGINIRGKSASGQIINNHFLNQKNAGLWVVFGNQSVAAIQDINIADNEFEGGLHSIVLGNASPHVRGNRLSHFTRTGVMLISGGPLIERNRIRNGRGFGLYLLEARGARITGNEIDHNDLVGILASRPDNVKINDNRLYENGYGIATVADDAVATIISGNLLVNNRVDGLLVIGDCPIVENNRATGNQQAGMRLLDLIYTSGKITPALPRLMDNTLEANRINQPITGSYRLERG